MLKHLLVEMRKLPKVVTRQELINWYLDNFTTVKCGVGEITTGELINLAKSCGKKIEGKSRLAIHINPKDEKEYALKSKADLRQSKSKMHKKIADSERAKIEDMYWRCGMSLQDIAKRYDCSPSTIQNCMKNWQMETRGRGVNTIASIKTQVSLTGL